MLVKDFERPKNISDEINRQSSQLKRSKLEELQETEKREETKKEDKVE